MKLRLLTAFVALGVLATGCNGPKDTCEGTLESYASILDGQHFDSMPDLIWQPQRKRYKDEAIASWAGESYPGVQSFKFTKIDASVAKGDICLASTLSKWHQKIRGQNPQDYEDEYNTYTLHLVDGKWFMELPGDAKIQAY